MKRHSKTIKKILKIYLKGQPKKQIELIDDIKNELEKDDAKELLNGLKIVKKVVDEFDKQQNQGNLPRAKYFEKLMLEIECNLKIKNFFTCNHLLINEMQNLIGNLSNYQLKELRRYFNDENMKDGDIWKPEQLYRVTWRSLSKVGTLKMKMTNKDKKKI